MYLFRSKYFFVRCHNSPHVPTIERRMVYPVHHPWACLDGRPVHMDKLCPRPFPQNQAQMQFIYIEISE